MLPTHLPQPSCTRAQSCNPMDYSPPGSSVHGFFQARILEWVTISFSVYFFFFNLRNRDLGFILSFIFIYLLCQVLVVACGVFVVAHRLQISWEFPSGGWDLSSLTRDPTHIPCLHSGFLTMGPPGKSLYVSLEFRNSLGFQKIRKFITVIHCLNAKLCR